MVATGASRVKVYDRDGKERGESLAGDMYIRDLRNTKGHISPCTFAQWHPSDKYTGKQGHAPEDQSPVTPPCCIKFVQPVKPNLRLLHP